jgi:hypothetical protein
MNCRPRRLFKEIGHRIGINWFRQPRSQLIFVCLPHKAAAESIAGDVRSDIVVRAWEPSEFIRRQ